MMLTYLLPYVIAYIQSENTESVVKHFSLQGQLMNTSKSCFTSNMNLKNMLNVPFNCFVGFFKESVKLRVVV
jgi:hypothetical protein